MHFFYFFGLKLDEKIDATHYIWIVKSIQKLQDKQTRIFTGQLGVRLFLLLLGVLSLWGFQHRLQEVTEPGQEMWCETTIIKIFITNYMSGMYARTTKSVIQQLGLLMFSLTFVTSWRVFKKGWGQNSSSPGLWWCPCGLTEKPTPDPHCSCSSEVLSGNLVSYKETETKKLLLL